MGHFLVNRDQLRETRVAEAGPPEVAEGQARLAVRTFGLTANNVTYAVMGEAMSYWDFFPTEEEGWGRVPMWGFAEVEESSADGVEVGTRLYGYLPPSSHLLVTPASADERGFTDGSPHRKPLPSAYHRYLATDSDPFYRDDSEALQMLLRPLFFTSFLIDDQLADEGFGSRGPVLVSSASSKTALAAAFMLAQREGVETVGLTSKRSLEFVEGLGIYGGVVSYEEIGELEVGAATYVDVAGDAGVRATVHEHFGDELALSMAVGITHWEEFEGATDLPGPAPAFFFAPDRVTKRAADWGQAGLEQRVAEAWHPFCEWTAGWLEVDHVEGFDALERAWVEVIDGEVEPSRAHVIGL